MPSVGSFVETWQRLPGCHIFLRSPAGMPGRVNYDALRWAGRCRPGRAWPVSSALHNLATPVRPTWRRPGKMAPAWEDKG